MLTGWPEHAGGGRAGHAAPALGYLRAPNRAVLLKVDFGHTEAHCKTKETE